jgi:Tubulin like
MLQPFLLVGVGGSGGKTLRALRHSLELRLKQEDWQEGWPKAWQMLHVDSPVSQDGASFPAKFLPNDLYFNLVDPGSTYKATYGAVTADLPAKHLAEIEKAIPSANDVNVQITIGAGKFRGVGRTLVLAKMKELTARISESFATMTSDGAISQLDSLGRKWALNQPKVRIQLR